MTKPLPHEKSISLQEEEILRPMYLGSHICNHVARGRSHSVLRRFCPLSLIFYKSPLLHHQLSALPTHLMHPTTPAVSVRNSLLYLVPEAFVVGVVLIVDCTIETVDTSIRTQLAFPLLQSIQSIQYMHNNKISLRGSM